MSELEEHIRESFLDAYLHCNTRDPHLQFMHSLNQFDNCYSRREAKIIFYGVLEYGCGYVAKNFGEILKTRNSL